MKSSLKFPGYLLPPSMSIQTKKIKFRPPEKANIEVKIEDLIQCFPEGVVVFNAARQVSFVNTTITAMTGLSSAGFDLSAFRRLFHHENLTNLAIRQVFSGKKFLHILEIKLTRFWYELFLLPLHHDTTTSGAILMLRDITREKEIDKTKTEFVSLASHQLRTPLSIMKWYGDMLLSDDVGRLNAKQQRYLRAVYESNQHMVDLVNALLNVSRIEMGTFTVEATMTNVPALARDVINGLTPQISSKKLKIKTYFNPAQLALSVDQQLLRIIFQNIISNSIKYSSAGTSIHITLQKNSSDLLFTVTDQGCGIPPEQQEKVFTKLFRADNAPSASPEGTGLGLYIVKSILDTVAGKIRFESKFNSGTTFFVTLPLTGMKSSPGLQTLIPTKI